VADGSASASQQQPSGQGEESLFRDYITGQRSQLAEQLKQAADFMKWRDQNFRRTPDGRWESPSARVYTDQELRTLYGEQQQPKSGTPKAPGKAAVGAKVADKAAQAKAVWFGDGRPGRGKKNPPIPPVAGSVGGGGSNNPADVKWIQQLLNVAIDNEDLSGSKLPEDGKITDSMLKLLDQYQSMKSLPRQTAVDRNSPTIKELASNPLFDPRWSGYEEIIKREVEYYNNFFRNKYPESFQPLDWRRVKAMLWVEVKGPDDSRDPNEWLVWPMQIGRRKVDPGMNAVKYGRENTDRYVPAELRNKLQRQHMTAELNIRAGIAYLYDRAIASWKTLWKIDDPAVRTYKIEKGDTLEGLARRLHTTVGELLQANGLDKEAKLKLGKPLRYRLAHEVPQWRDWPTASFLYNSGRNDPDYGNKVERNYIKIKRRW